MSLLELDAVTKSYGRGTHRRVVLRGVSLELRVGEMVAIWGLRRSGRSTLLRIAAGLEAPDAGAVRIDGRSLQGRDGDRLRGAIGYCRRAFGRRDGRAVFDQLTLGQLARGASPEEAALRARTALARAGAQQYASLLPGALGAGEAVRVAIARALAGEPRLLVIDEPTLGVDLLERDDILALLRSLADEGLAVLTSTDRTSGLAGANRAFALSEGELRGGFTSDAPPELAPVIPLRRPA